ncbi:metalloprotease [Pterulicium gracile]|uniref:Extracellular metalloproteinase n=1 Tax=Pterulicium gracile TaxID=1884261 RepID=A0A5C3QD21_9AGAR|nr:metalloprotease [Pterula gracilis]
MVQFNKFFSSVYLAVVYASIAAAAPGSTSHSNPGTTTVHTIGKRGVELKAFSPPSKYETFEEGIEPTSADSLRSSSLAPLGLKEATIAFLRERLSVDSASIRYRNGFNEEKNGYAYVAQQHDGVEFANSVANVAFRDNKVVAFGNSFVEPAAIADSTPTVSLQDAIATAENALEGKHDGVEPKLEYVVVEDGSAILAHVVQIRNDGEKTWYQAFVDAHSGELKSVVDFYAHATYRIVPLEHQYPTDGFKTVINPQWNYPGASPNGWHTYECGRLCLNKEDTAGNNVISFKGDLANTTQSQTRLLEIFTPRANFETSPTTTENVDAGRVNTFYITNELHDIWYLYGFTETSYNFQNDNFGKGGAGNDRVQVSVQDSQGFNNALFGTPPDGQPGQMYMFLWNTFTPNRDGDLENDVIVHEYTHGLTNRLTGGGTARCLSSVESRGLGEGWSDAMADWSIVKSTKVEDFELAVWANGRNLREFPYSPSATVNPLRYRDVANRLSSPHRIGQVWANLLHNVHIDLLAAHGFDRNAKKNPRSTKGNGVFLHLFIDALKLQPCQPTFVTARAAWIQADAVRYNGKNKCLLWKAFAARGLGVNAVSGSYVDDTTVPADCA